MRGKAGDAITSVQLDTLRSHTFFGREKDDTIYPIALANLILHGIDEPHIWHGNTLSGIGAYEELFRGAPQFFNYILMNPPFGGKEGTTAQTPFEYKTGATQILFLQHVLKSLTPGGTCGIVLDEGVLFRTNETAFVQTKRKLLEECDIWCILSLAGGVFSSAGAGVKTNLVFFTKGRPTETIWYYDLSDMKVGKKTPLTQAHFEEFFKLLPTRGDSERSWTVPFAARLQKALEEARPFRERAAESSRQAADKEDTFKERRKAKSASQEDLVRLEEDWKSTLRESREALAKAESMENVVFDLKAVNPNRTNNEDKRTPEELVAVIKEKGHEADAALERLQKLIEGHRDTSAAQAQSPSAGITGPF
jgi:type I restriction enzyme M protein